jgi:predicted ATPase/class 3 adenylate cyclase
MSNRPSGTVTFLFTDIEGSTRLWEAHPQAMQAALARHDALLRHTIEDNSGYVFKTVGDAFCAAFPTALFALQAALQAQRLLIEQDWGETPIKVRMALHSGAADERDGDYFGPPLNLIARLLSAGYGGQVLMTQAVKELLRGMLPEGVGLSDLGEHYLKDVAQSERIFQISAPYLPADFPPLKTQDTLPNNLPIELTNFIGRQREVNELKALLTGDIQKNGRALQHDTRLVTLTGPGGTGKTRLSLQVAMDLLPLFAGGVWLVELAPVRDPALLPSVVMTTLRTRSEANQSPLSILIRQLSDKHVLILLDNCEHLISACAEMAATLLRHCPRLFILTTSCEALGMTGETIFPVMPLSLPKGRAGYTPELALQTDAIRLFVDRATAVRAGFRLTTENVSAVVRICHRLDGIPLALELAAARTRVLKVEQIAERLDNRFRLLTVGGRAALPHHQTLRATIDWSYDLLPEKECVVFRRLSVFAGGWRLEDAEEVCANQPAEGLEVLVDRVEVFDLLDSLISKSLVLVDYTGDEAARYRMLETIRQYAADKLEEAGETALMRDQHLKIYINLMEEAAPALEGIEQADWMNRLENELDNLRAALVWAREGLCGDLGPELALSLTQFWYTRGYFIEGRDQLKAMLTAAPPGTALQARLLDAIAFMSRYLGDHEDVRRAILQSKAIWLGLGNQQGVADSLANLGYATLYRGEFDEAKGIYEDSLAIYRSLDNWQGIADASSHLGVIAFYQAHYQVATELHNESLAIWRTLGDRKGIAYALRHLADTALQAGNEQKAYGHAMECLLTSRELAYKEGMCGSLEVFAGLAAQRDPVLALHLLGVAAVERETVGISLAKTHQLVIDDWIRPARERLSYQADTVYKEGRRSISLEQAIASVLSSPEKFV